MTESKANSGRKEFFKNELPTGGISPEHSDYYPEVVSTETSAQPGLPFRLKAVAIALGLTSAGAVVDGALRSHSFWEIAAGVGGLALIGGGLHLRNIYTWAQDMNAAREYL